MGTLEKEEKQSPPLAVVVAVIEGAADKILISQRTSKQTMAGFWELPGGKIEANESTTDALVRELQEELGITATHYEAMATVPYDYPEYSIILHAWRVTAFQGMPQGCEGQVVKWVDKSELADYTFPAANKSIITALGLSQWYQFTPELPAQLNSTEQRFNWLKQHAWQGQLSGRLIRLRASAQLTASQYRQLVQQVEPFLRENNALLMLDFQQQFLDLPCRGFHLTEQQLLQSKEKPTAKSSLLAASVHSAPALQQAQRLGVDFACLSPIKPTASHLESRPLGWQVFSALLATSALPVYALGGLNKDDLTAAKRAGAQGVAGISLFLSHS